MLDLLRDWPANKTRGFIYLSINPKGIDWATTLARNVYEHFNKQYNYPFVVLSESSEIATKLRAAINDLGQNASLLGQVFAYDISRFWNVPDFILARHSNSMQTFVEDAYRSIERSGCGYPASLNYWLMCRFQAKGITEIPFVQNFEYIWRLDRDSALCGELPYDIFSFMKENDYWQGYVAVDTYDQCAQKLTEHVKSFVTEHNIIPAQGFASIADARTNYIYNNFEIFKVDFYLSQEYQLFMNYTEHSGGFFYYRWGDAPVRTQASRLFMHPLRMKHFKPREVYYQHQYIKRCKPS